jgi:hypothetical protein
VGGKLNIGASRMDLRAFSVRETECVRDPDKSSMARELLWPVSQRKCFKNGPYFKTPPEFYAFLHNCHITSEI